MNEEASAQGVQPGMPLSSAQAICTRLHAFTRQADAEVRALHLMGSLALDFSAAVSLQPPHSVLLEIGGSLKLFGSLEALLAQMQQAIAALGYDCRYGVAVTAAGAQILARAGESRVAMNLTQLQSMLRPLPIGVLDWPPRLQDRLRSVGVETLGDVLDLPAAGFRQRYGADILRRRGEWLDQQISPRTDFCRPARYQGRLDALQESFDLQVLAPGFERLFAELAVVLRAGDCGVDRLQLGLRHDEQRVTWLNLGLLQPGRDPLVWQTLLNDRLARCALPAAVRSIELRADNFVSLGDTQAGFWADAQAEEGLLLERLGARLGPSRLYGLKTCQAHVPEKAGMRTRAGEGGDAAVCQGDFGRRPLWLLPVPESIDGADLRLIAGPERLETCWWDSPCQRDYYQALDGQGRRLWVFREHQSPQTWLVHGVFA